MNEINTLNASGAELVINNNYLYALSSNILEKFNIEGTDNIFQTDIFYSDKAEKQVLQDGILYICNGIIGVSIFTHLREKVQFEWLKELHRIAKNDGILLMTVHGEEAVKCAVLTIKYLISLKLKGFLDMGHNPSLDRTIRDNTYYRTIYHRKRYIQNRWGKYFEIIDIIPGCIGNMQDLVIMKKK